MRFLRWIADYWYVPLLGLGALIGAIFLTRAKPGYRKIWERMLVRELAAIEAKRETRQIRLEHGAAEAKRHVSIKYAEKRKQLDVQAEARMRELEGNPEKLAKTLERLTR